MKEKIQAIVLDCCAQHNQMSDRIIPIELAGAAPLYGDGVLDSIALVSLIVAVEQGIEDAMDVIVTLADAKAFSHGNSPFRTVDSLVMYAQARIKEEIETHG